MSRVLNLGLRVGVLGLGAFLDSRGLWGKELGHKPTILNLLKHFSSSQEVGSVARAFSLLSRSRLWGLDFTDLGWGIVDNFLREAISQLS